MITSPSNTIKEYLKRKESLRLKAYKLSGESGYTIGYGNKYYANGTSVKSTDTITATAAAQLFDKILAQFAAQVRASVTANVSQSQFDALLSYSYNRGIGAFRASNLLKMVNANPNDSRIANQFVIEWGSNTAYKAALIERRKEEAAIYGSNQSTSNQFLYLIPTAILAYGLYKAFK